MTDNQDIYWEDLDIKNSPIRFEAYECAAEIKGDMGLGDDAYKELMAAFIKGYRLAMSKHSFDMSGPVGRLLRK